MLADLRLAVRAVSDRTTVRSSSRGFWTAPATGWRSWRCSTVAADGSRENGSAFGWTLALWIAPRIVLDPLPPTLGERLGRSAGRHSHWPRRCSSATFLVAIATPARTGIRGVAARNCGGARLCDSAHDRARVGALRRGSRPRADRQVQCGRFFRRPGSGAGRWRGAVLMALTLSGTVSRYLQSWHLLPRPRYVRDCPDVPARQVVAPRRGGRRPVARIARQTVIWLQPPSPAGAVGARAADRRVHAAFRCGRLRHESGAILVAAAGLGLLLGPLPIPRLLLRASAELILIVLAVVVAVALSRSPPSGRRSSRSSFPCSRCGRRSVRGLWLRRWQHRSAPLDRSTPARATRSGAAHPPAVSPRGDRRTAVRRFRRHQHRRSRRHGDRCSPGHRAGAAPTPRALRGRAETH